MPFPTQTQYNAAQVAAAQSGQAPALDLNTILGTMVDRGIWPYYDTQYLQLSAGSGTLNASYTFFAQQNGATDQVTGVGRTFTQTNMISQGNNNGFGATRCFILMAFGFRFPSFMSKANVDAIIETANFTFQINEKPFFQGRMEDWPGGAGLMGVSAVSGEETWTLGLPVPEAMRRFTLKYAKYIAPTIPFYFTVSFPQQPTLTFPNIPSGVGITNPNNSATCVPFLRVMLDGLTDRAVQ